MPAKKTKKPARPAAKKKTTISVKKNVGKSNVIVGNKNQVNLIVNEYAYSLDKKSQMDLKRQIEEYLDTMYVPLQAELQIFDAEHELKYSGRSSINGVGNQLSMWSRNITLNEILAFGNRLIVTGGPGSGKTTILLHLA